MLNEDVAVFVAGPGKVSAFPCEARTDPSLAAEYLTSMRSRRPPAGEVESVKEVRNRVVGSGVPIRTYQPDGDGPFPVVVYFHGGGWVLGDLEMHDSTCRAMANAIGAVVVNVDYRLAPEHRFPAAFDDCLEVTRWVASVDDLPIDPTRLAIAGSSAGGNLAAAVALAAQQSGVPTVALQVLIYPVIDSSMSSSSYEENAAGYFLERPQMAWYWDQYVPDPLERENPFASPAHAADLTGLPSAIVVTAEHDPLRDEGEAYAERMRQAGVQVVCRRYPGQIHGFLGLLGVLADAKPALERLCADMREVLVG